MRLLGLFFAVLSLMFASCGSIEYEAGTRYYKRTDIDVQMLNEGKRIVEDAMIKMGKYYTISGGLAGSGSMVHSFSNHPIPSTVEMIYSFDGKNYG